MAQEPVNLIDRDTLIAAILTGQWGGDAGSPEEAVEAFRQTLVALRAAGGAVNLWNNADPETED